VPPLSSEDLAVEEQQRRLGLVLGRRRDRAIDREVRQKGLDLRSAERCGMAHAVKVNEATCPLDIGLLGADRIVAHPQRLAQAGEQSWRCGGRPRRLALDAVRSAGGHFSHVAHRCVDGATACGVIIHRAADRRRGAATADGFRLRARWARTGWILPFGPLVARRRAAGLLEP
jgi:hypothetical protein